LWTTLSVKFFVRLFREVGEDAAARPVGHAFLELGRVFKVAPANEGSKLSFIREVEVAGAPAKRVYTQDRFQNRINAEVQQMASRRRVPMSRKVFSVIAAVILLGAIGAAQTPCSRTDEPQQVSGMSAPPYADRSKHIHRRHVRSTPKPPPPLICNVVVPPTPPCAGKLSQTPNPPPPLWDEQLVKTLSSSGFSLVSLSLAAFTFLYGALVGLRNDKDDGNRKHFAELQAKLAVAIYWIAGTVVLASTITFLANIDVAFQIRIAGLVSIFLAGLLLLAVPGLVLYLAHDIYKRRSS
jgi:hypothetical protein